MPENVVKGREFVVQESQLDTNHHVNNGQYVRMAMNQIELPKVSELRVEYKKQALLGDMIVPFICRRIRHLFRLMM